MSYFYVVGSNGVCRSCLSANPTVWIDHTVGTAQTLRAIHSANLGSIWVGGDNGTVFNYSSGIWTDYSIPSTNYSVYGLWVFAENDIWAICSRHAWPDGAAFWFNGSNWVQKRTFEYNPTSGRLVLSTWGYTANNGTQTLYVVGSGDNFYLNKAGIWRWTGAAGVGAWVGPDATPFHAEYCGVYGVDLSNVFVMQREAVTAVVSYKGQYGAWGNPDSPPYQHRGSNTGRGNTVFAADAAGIPKAWTWGFADAGADLNKGHVRRWTGSAWQSVYVTPTTGYSNYTSGIHGANSQEIMAVAYQSNTTPRYIITDDGGDTWTLGTISGSAFNPIAVLGIEVPEPLIRVALPGLYADHFRYDDDPVGIALINTIPEDNETDVKDDALIELWIVSLTSVVVDSTLKVWVTINDGTKELAYDGSAGGFQTGYNGANSSATWQASPDAGLNDETVIRIHPETAFPSGSSVTVEVSASAGAYVLSEEYTFYVQYTEAPVVDEILWITPRKARLRFRETMEYGTDEGEILYLVDLTGRAEFAAPDRVTVQGALDSNWIGYWLGIFGSGYPFNNGYHKISGLDAVNKQLILDVGSHNIVADDGIDTDADGRIIRQRMLRCVISSHRIEGRPQDESEIACAFEPVVTSLRSPEIDEIPLGADSERYIIVELHDDISYGRAYKWHIVKAENEYGQVADATSEFAFTSPSFGMPIDRIKLWDFFSEFDKDEDELAENLLEKMCCVLQDLLNVLWQRCDTLQYLNDPDSAPENWIPYLLYSLANPFQFPMTLQQQRALATILVIMHKRGGTIRVIEETLGFFLNGTFDVRTFHDASWWILGTSILGTDTILGPGSTYAKNCYEIISSRILTESERLIVRQIAEYLDPPYMHLVRIVEP